MESKFFVILGNQLFDPKILKKNNCNEVFMAEDYELCTYFKHHKLKLFLFLTAMREYRDELKNKSISVNYFELSNRKVNETYIDCLIKFLKDREILEINIFEIEDTSFEKHFLKALAEVGVEVNIINSPMFLFERNDFVSMAKGKKVYRMSSFYQKARKNMKILIDENNKPIGGKWSFDEENRKKIPKNVTPPEMTTFKESKYCDEVKNLINSNFDDHPGNLNDIWFPVDRAGAQKQLDNFLKVRFENFGIYEDAMLENKNFLFHSCISPFLNIGLLTPDKVISKTLQYAEKNRIPMNSVEGFVRQIIGWREFIRGIYHEEGEVQINSNYWKHTKKLTQSWYDGTTGIDPLDDCIKTTLKDGYIHHIPRLMVISNIMNLCGIDPREIYKWFMEMYIDSSDWVMVPNVFGMATYADGGMMSTKPYTCGSNYILKMSNFKKGEWCDIVDGLYWSFIERNMSEIKKNYRMSMMANAYKKISEERKKTIFTKANKFIKNNSN